MNMERIKNGVIGFLPVLIISAFASLCSVGVCVSGFPDRSKLTVVLLLIIGAGLLDAWLLSHLLSELIRKANEQKEKIISEQESKLKQSDNAIAALKKDFSQRPVHTGNMGLGLTALQEKCSYLEQLRASFPYTVNDGYLIFNLMRTEVSVSEYSRWLIVGSFAGELWSLSILRPDTQTYKELLQLISATKAPEDIQAFSTHNNLLWM